MRQTKILRTVKFMRASIYILRVKESHMSKVFNHKDKKHDKTWFSMRGLSTFNWICSTWEEQKNTLQELLCVWKKTEITVLLSCFLGVIFPSNEISPHITPYLDHVWQTKIVQELLSRNSLRRLQEIVRLLQF